MKLNDNSVLLVIDVQKAFDNPRWGERNNPEAEKNIAKLIAAWRDKGLPLIHVHHRNPREGSLFNPGAPGVEVKPEGAPKSGEPVLFKDVNSAFIGTDLQARLQATKANTLILVGMTTDHCVATTTRMAGNYGFDAYVVSDATATFERTEPDGRHFTAQQMHDTALASLRGEFATIISTDEALQALTELEEGIETEVSEVPEKFKQYTQRLIGNVTGDPLEVQASTATKLTEVTKGMSRDNMEERPAPDKWSIAEILAHLADAEVAAAYRLRKIVGEPGTPIQAFDQDCWATNMNYSQRDPEQSLKHFRALREVNLSLLRSLTPEQWECYGIHAERGKESVRHMVRLYAGHDLNHLKQIEAIISRKGASSTKAKSA